MDMANFRTAMTAMAVAVALTGSQAVAADLSLAPGKPAGVRQAQHGSPSLLLVGLGVAAAVAAIVIATQSDSAAVCSATNCPPATSTTAT
jgi:hypothetical protein